MDKFWLKSYEKGVATEIDFTQYRSLNQLLESQLPAGVEDSFTDAGRAIVERLEAVTTAAGKSAAITAAAAATAA